MNASRRRVQGLWLCGLLCGAHPATAATYYVRGDGGDAAQCSGTTDAAYSKTVNMACGWKHPFIALPPHATPRIQGGDTLLIRRGSYMIGFGAPDTGACKATAPADCAMAPIPGGPGPAHPTRILGEGHGTGCKAPPELWGTHGVRGVLRLVGGSNIEIACLDVTDHSSCIVSHNNQGVARGETSRCPDAVASTATWGEDGIYAADASRVLLRDLHIHGLAGNGVRAGRLRDWTVQRVRLRANGWAGWDGNLNQGEGRGSANGGSLRFSGGEIAWNGCGERYPGREVFGCWAQQQGGYGDGLGTAETGGDWLFEDLSIHNNASDGLDLLYMDGSGSVTIRRVRAQGNAGNQIKVSGPVTIENSIVLGNCGFFADFPTSNLGKGDHCRAKGNTLSIRPTPGSLATLRHNTISGQGDCLMITSHGAASGRVLVQNNAFIGDLEWGTPPILQQLTCAHYAVESQTPVRFENNLFSNVKNGFCPPGNLCTRDPMLTLTTYARFDAMPRRGSPLVDAGKPLPQPDRDFLGHPRAVGRAPDIGAIEVQATGGRSP